MEEEREDGESPASTDSAAVAATDSSAVEPEPLTASAVSADNASDTGLRRRRGGDGSDPPPS